MCQVKHLAQPQTSRHIATRKTHLLGCWLELQKWRTLFLEQTLAELTIFTPLYGTVLSENITDELGHGGHTDSVLGNMRERSERISRILELREILMSIQTGFNLVNAAVVCAILE